MKRFYWLLALPYVVTISHHEGWQDTYRVGVSTSVFFDMQDRTMADDLAAALNEAHKKREDDAFLKRGSDSLAKMKKEDSLYWKDSKKVEWEDPVNISPITNKQACGQNDCGADPK